MKRKNYVVASLLSVLLAMGASAKAQRGSSLSWTEDLQRLEQQSVDSTEVMRIRTEAENWLSLHPSNGYVLPQVAALPWSEAQLQEQKLALRQLIKQIVQQNPDHPLHLGLAQVQVTEKISDSTLVTGSIDQSLIRNINAVTAAKALDYLPGVSIQHITTNRNEAGIMIRGFSSRGQVPLYLDGIPIYVPYDGYVDFNRFLTSDLAQIDVSRGIASPLLGPNALGGSINMVTRESLKRWEGEALLGTAAGNGLLSSARAGTRREKGFLQGTIDWNQADFMPISGNFGLNSFQPNDERKQSYFRDEKFGGRAGWTPRKGDEYVFSYTNQKGQKGVPLYAGANSAATFKNFWKWPYWNKSSYYFLSNTGLGPQSFLKFRAFYDQFRNSIDMFDDATYTTMKSASSQHSMYDDHTDGTSIEFRSQRIPRNAFAASFFFKDDTHRERGIYPAKSPYPLVQPWLVDRDQQTSLGLQDAITLHRRVLATVGFSSDHIKGMQAQAYNSAGTALTAVTCTAAPKNSAYSGCTANDWNYNPQVSVSYNATRNDTFFVTFADRGRFPMLKDSYSYSMGKGIPNPDLKPEQSRNWNIGYSCLLPATTSVELVLFRSDLRNAIESVYVADTQSLCSNTGGLKGYCSQNINIGKEVHEGVELNLHSTPVRRATFDGSYSYLNREIEYNFNEFSNVSKVNTTVQILPTLPKNKFVGNATLRLPKKVMAIGVMRYEGGLTVQDTTYSSTSPLYKAYSTSFGTVDLAGVAPLYFSDHNASVQLGVKNLLDRNYFYVPGFPEPGRNWYLNFRYQF